MKFDYKGMQGRATALLDRFTEVEIQIIRTTGTNMVDGEAVKGTTSPELLSGVISPIAKSLVNGTTIQEGDFIATITYLTEPKMSDVFIIDGQNYQVVAIEKFKPSATVLAYKVQLRA